MVANLGMLGYFKYGQFLLDNFTALMASIGVAYQPAHYDIVLPVGISFYTFATLSYTLDVYLRRALPARNFLDYALFVTFFPHLVAGPIMRPTELVPQFAAAAPRDRRPAALRPGADDDRPVQQDRARRQFPVDRGRTRLRQRQAARRARCLDRHARVQRPDLLRLRRLLDDRDRRGAVPGLRDAGQLPLSVRRGRLLGFLAALAHHAVVVAARLPVHPARRQSPRRRAAPMPR